MGEAADRLAVPAGVSVLLVSLIHERRSGGRRVDEFSGSWSAALCFTETCSVASTDASVSKDSDENANEYKRASYGECHLPP